MHRRSRTLSYAILPFSACARVTRESRKFNAGGFHEVRKKSHVTINRSLLRQLDGCASRSWRRKRDRRQHGIGEPGNPGTRNTIDATHRSDRSAANREHHAASYRKHNTAPNGDHTRSQYTGIQSD